MQFLKDLSVNMFEDSYISRFRKIQGSKFSQKQKMLM